MILETINSPADVKRLSEEDAVRLCQELRRFLVEQVSRTGGHLASNLGVVELTVAIHRVYDTASDRLVLDAAGACSDLKVEQLREHAADTLQVHLASERAQGFVEMLEELKVLKPADIESLYLIIDDAAQARVTALLL